MEIGLLGLGDQYAIPTVVAAAASAAEEGFETYWLPGEIDPISALVAAGREVPDIKLGISVIPVYSRHPVALAAEALMANQAIDGRLILGIGLSHRPIVETKWGQSFDRPVRLLREYLQILGPLLERREVDFMGEMLGAQIALRVDGASKPTLLVAAMGPQTLRVAGKFSDGTDTWMTGPKTLSDLTVPTLTAAAASVERPAPIVAAGMPVCVTTDLEGARMRAAATYGHHAGFPTYRTMLDREGKAGPEDLAMIGDADGVRAELGTLRDLGVTHFIASPFGTSSEMRQTRATLRALAAELA